MTKEFEFIVQEPANDRFYLRWATGDLAEVDIIAKALKELVRPGDRIMFSSKNEAGDRVLHILAIQHPEKLDIQYQDGSLPPWLGFFTL